ncbi:hypothetical protein ACUODJ_43340, partial [Escherichia sp. HC-CC]
FVVGMLLTPPDVFSQTLLAIPMYCLYEETAESVEKREKMAMARKLNALTMPHPDRRPDKKERRDLLRFKHGDSE